MTYYKQRDFTADEERNAMAARAARRRVRKQERARERAAVTDLYAGGVFHVNGWTGNDDNDGHSNETPLATLQVALDRAEPGALICVNGPVGRGIVETSYITITGTMMSELPHLTINASGFFGYDLTVEPMPLIVGVTDDQ